jgi:hypothetical protein
VRVHAPSASAEPPALAHEPFRNLRWVSDAPARFVGRPAPRSSAIAGAVDLYAEGRTVLAATRKGISRSVDGGRRWNTVLAGYEMAWVSRGPSGYFAIGVTRTQRAATATSPDGMHWSVTIDHDSRAAEGSIHGTAVMVGRTAVDVTMQNRWFGGTPMMRTTDGGRHWRRVPGMRYAQGGLRLLPDDAMVATAPGAERRCDGAVWRSVDLGATWQELPGSCSPLPLTDVQFTSANDGVAVGGFEWKVGGGDLIETTDDGGIAWTRTHYVPNCYSVRCQNSAPDGFGAVDFLTASSGFVFHGECVDSLPGPCGGKLLWTSDGGRTLRQLASPPGDGWLSIAVTGPGRYVGAAYAPDGEKPFSAIGLTTDSGRRWRYEAPPNDFESDYGGPLSGAGRHLLWISPVGTLASYDGGRRWRLVRDPRAARSRLRAYRRGIGVYDRDTRTSFGRAQWSLRTPGLSSRTWMLYRPRPGVPWQGRQLPNWVGEQTEAVIATGPNTAIFAGRNGNLWRSRDDGATWQETWPHLPGEGR